MEYSYRVEPFEPTSDGFKWLLIPDTGNGVPLQLHTQPHWFLVLTHAGDLAETSCFSATSGPGMPTKLWTLTTRDQKSLFATFQSHCSISSIKSADELQRHSVNVRANCASIIFLTTSSCRMHWSTCRSKACVSTPDGRGHS